MYSFQNIYYTLKSTSLVQTKETQIYGVGSFGVCWCVILTKIRLSADVAQVKHKQMPLHSL